jgi:UDP-N-acetylglucosamine--N-acetylmuramyl-(pentapeptide) pyrophosphoryl-undecaprenol N-acetylglucosamine transferase
VFRLVSAVWQAGRKMKRFKPDVILGTGGYVAFPTCLAAFFGKRPFFLHESNVLPGFVNRSMCWYARCVFTAFKIPENQLKERVCVTPLLF